MKEAIDALQGLIVIGERDMLVSKNEIQNCTRSLQILTAKYEKDTQRLEGYLAAIERLKRGEIK